MSTYSNANITLDGVEHDVQDITMAQVSATDPALWPRPSTPITGNCRCKLNSSESRRMVYWMRAIAARVRKNARRIRVMCRKRSSCRQRRFQISAYWRELNTQCDGLAIQLDGYRAKDKLPRGRRQNMIDGMAPAVQFMRWATGLMLARMPKGEGKVP